MTKLAILLDPNKRAETERVYQAILKFCREGPYTYDEYKNHLEFWCGDTKEIYKGVHMYLKKLRQANLGIPIVIFPGHPLQVSSQADYLMIPTLLNTTRRFMKMMATVGKIYYLIFKNYMRTLRRPYPKPRMYGYLVLSPYSRVGNKLGAKNLTDNEALQLIQTHLKESWWGIYLEAGSGVDHAASIAQRLELVKRTKTTFPNKILLTGGGIVSPKQIRNLKEAGADIIVVSTVLEKSDNPYDLITEFIEVLIEP